MCFVVALIHFVVAILYCTNVSVVELERMRIPSDMFIFLGVIVYMYVRLFFQAPYYSTV